MKGRKIPENYYFQLIQIQGEGAFLVVGFVVSAFLCIFFLNFDQLFSSAYL